MFIDRHFIYVCDVFIVISLRSDSDCNKESTYLLITRSSSAVTLARPSVSSSLQITNRSFTCITSPVQSAPFFIPSTSFYSLSSWFTSSCAYHLITVTTFMHSHHLSLPRPFTSVGIGLKELGSDVEMFEILHRHVSYQSDTSYGWTILRHVSVCRITRNVTVIALIISCLACCSLHATCILIAFLRVIRSLLSHVVCSDISVREIVSVSVLFVPSVSVITINYNYIGQSVYRLSRICSKNCFSI